MGVRMPPGRRVFTMASVLVLLNVALAMAVGCYAAETCSAPGLSLCQTQQRRRCGYQDASGRPFAQAGEPQP